MIEDVKGLVIKDMTVKWNEENPEKNWQSALVLNNVSGFEIRYFSGRQGLLNGSDPAILLEKISDGLISESKAETGCKTFIGISKAESKNVILRNNNAKKADKAIAYFQ